MNAKKKVYVGMAGDILHEGHINILKAANKFGDVTVGLLTDKAISTYKRFPHLNYKQRLAILKSVKYVKKIVPQETVDYSRNLIKYKPRLVIYQWPQVFRRSFSHLKSPLSELQVSLVKGSS